MIRFKSIRTAAATLFLAAACSGCSGSSDEDPMARTPEEAASQIEQAYAEADALTRQAAAAAAEAMRRQEYEKAVVSLQTVKSAPEATVEQGLAVHGSMVTLEAQLISAMEAGDKNAERAYQLLKALKRN